MKTVFTFTVMMLCLLTSNAFCNTVIWNGHVSSDGTRSPNIKLVPGQAYQYRVTGTAILGNWSRNGQPLVNDALYEFNAVGKPMPMPILKNSLGIVLGDGKFHSDHVYESATFTPEKDEISFWIFDTNYNDNKGALQVELFLASPSEDNAIVIWKGPVQSSGAPSPLIPLTIGKTYQITVSGQISLGTWSKNGKKMQNDACYEFSAVGIPMLLPTFNNSLDISVCDGKFHPNHIYQSTPFKAEKDSINFWIFDTDYNDNSGELQVQLNLVK